MAPFEYYRSLNCQWMIFLALLITIVKSQSLLEYSIVEEETPTIVLGNILSDTTQLGAVNISSFDSIEFRIVNIEENVRDYFSIDSVGNLLVVYTINRDEICPMLSVCDIKFDIQIITDSDFYLVKVSVSITDINDEIPTFREDTFTVELSEASAIGMSLNLPIASDLDSPENGIVGYSVQDLDSVFEFQSGPNGGLPTEPIIHLVGQLDRELVDSYTFILLAEDSSSISQTGSARINVNVLDVNDNSPVFEKDLYEVDISESLQPGEEIVRVVATDIDEGENARILYQFNEQTIDVYGDLFIVEEDTGRVVLNEELDYKTVTEASLTIRARNEDTASLYSQTKVEITIQDVNDNAPSIKITDNENREVSISEYTGADEFIAHVTVSDDDTGEGGRFDCTLNSPYFELDKILDTDFKLKTSTTFDRETVATYEIKIICTDRGSTPLKSESIVRIDITDENDNRPIFSYDSYAFNVTENTPAGTVIATLTATDIDIGSNALLTYSLVDFDQDFAIATYLEIDESSGKLTTKQILDHEGVNEFFFAIVAMDHGNPALSGTCNVSMHILDQDDNAPLFNRSSFTIGVAENNDIGSEIASFVAKDLDSVAAFTEITYELNSPDYIDSPPFIIDPNSGVVFSNVSLDREEVEEYTLELVARGPPPMNHNSSSTLHIEVIDVNDNIPSIIFPSDDNDTISPPAILEKGSIIARIRGSDKDDNDNARLSYFIVSGDVDEILTLEESSGLIKVRQDYKATHAHTLELHILVSDNGEPRLSADTHLYVVFNETVAQSSALNFDNRGQNENIAILIGVLSGLVVIALIIAIICVIRHRKSYVKTPKPTRLTSVSDTVSHDVTSSTIQYGDFPGDSSKYSNGSLRGYDNPGLEVESTSDRPPFTATGYSQGGVGVAGAQPPVKDSGSEGSNTDSGHGSHEDTSSIPGVGSLQKWDNVFLQPDDRAGGISPRKFESEQDGPLEDQNNYVILSASPPPYRSPSVTQPFEHVYPNETEEDYRMTSYPHDMRPRSQSWVPMEEYPAAIEGDLSYSMHPNDYNTETPELYGHQYDGHRSPQGPVIDLRDFGRDKNEQYVDEEGDYFDANTYGAISNEPIPRHLKRRSNSFANDYFPSREYDVYPDHIAGFCTPQPKNIKYCSQV